MGKTEEEILREAGVWDPEHGVTDLAGAAKEIAGLKKAVKTRERENREYRDQIKAFEDGKQGRPEESYEYDEAPRSRPDPDLEKRLASTERRLMKMSHPDYEDYEEDVRELVSRRPGLRDIVDPVERFDLAMDMVKMERDLKKVPQKTDSARAEGAEKERLRASSYREGSGAVVGGPESDEVTEERLTEQLREELEKLPPGSSRNAKVKIANKYRRKIAALQG